MTPPYETPADTSPAGNCRGAHASRAPRHFYQGTRRYDAMVAALRALAEHGMTQKFAGRQVGLTQGQVSQIATREGICFQRRQLLRKGPADA